MSTEALAELHSSLIDANQGYETAIEEAENTDVRMLFEKAYAVHSEAHADLHGILVERGAQPDESGGFMSLVHKAVISVRSAVSGIDESSLKSFADGEERLAKNFSEAIEKEDNPSTVAVLQEHQTALRELIADMRRHSSAGGAV